MKYRYNFDNGSYIESTNCPKIDLVELDLSSRIIIRGKKGDTLINPKFLLSIEERQDED